MFGLPGVGQRNHVPVNQRINNYLRDIRVLIPVMGLISTLCVEFQRSTGMITNEEANFNRFKNIEIKGLAIQVIFAMFVFNHIYQMYQNRPHGHENRNQ